MKDIVASSLLAAVSHTKLFKSLITYQPKRVNGTTLNMSRMIAVGLLSSLKVVMWLYNTIEEKISTTRENPVINKSTSNDEMRAPTGQAHIKRVVANEKIFPSLGTVRNSQLLTPK